MTMTGKTRYIFCQTDIFWWFLMPCKYVGVQTRWYENYDSDASKSQSSPTLYQDLFLFAHDVAYGKKLICTVQCMGEPNGQIL